jgi:hypothetical protein
MFYIKETDTYIHEGQQFIHKDVQYSQDWASLSPDEKEALGFTEVTTSGEPADDRDFFVSSVLDKGVRTYINTPKDSSMLAKRDAQAEITRLESTVTQRRLREAALGDTTYLQSVTDLIAIQVAILKG